MAAGYSQSRAITVDDGFFFLAIVTLIAGTFLVYLDIPYLFLVQGVQAGLIAAPAGT